MFIVREPLADLGKSRIMATYQEIGLHTANHLIKNLADIEAKDRNDVSSVQWGSETDPDNPTQNLYSATLLNCAGVALVRFYGKWPADEDNGVDTPVIESIPICGYSED